MQTALTAMVDEALDERLARLTRATGRTRDSLVAEALIAFLEREEALLAAVEEGRRDVAAGRVVDHAEVVREFERLIGQRG